MVRRLLAIAMVAALGSTLMLIQALPAAGAALTVNDTGDDGDAAEGDGVCATSVGTCTLRAAVEEANALAGDDTVTFNASTNGSLITLGFPLEVSDSVRIAGNGPGKTLIGGAEIKLEDVASTTLASLGFQNPTDEAFEIDATSGTMEVTIDDVVIDGAGGEGIFIDGFGTSTVTATLTDTVITSSTFEGIGVNASRPVFLTVADSTVADNGGSGIESDGSIQGTVTIRNSTLSGNGRDGLGLDGDVAWEVSDSTFEGNGSDGIDADGTGLIVGTTFLDNDDDGLDPEGSAAVTVINSTFSGNRESAVDADTAEVSVELVNVTIADNQLGIENEGTPGHVSMVNTIVAGNIDGDCFAPIDSGGGNIDGDGSCGLTASGDRSGVDPLLGDLADNGGPTLTHMPSAASPAVDTGLPDACPNADQRGVSRPRDGDDDGLTACDVGSVEIGALLEPVPAPSGEEPAERERPASTVLPASGLLPDREARPAVAVRGQPRFTG